MAHEIFIHIGLIKTGSTFLQTEVFSKLSDPFIYTKDGRNLLTRDLFVTSQRKLILSNENLSGNPLLVDSYEISYFDQFKNCIDSIKSIYKAPKLIVGFREPSSFLLSLYKQHLHEWGILSWNQFLDNKYQQFSNDLYFSKYIDYLQVNFNNNDLFIYDQSDLLNDSNSIVSQLMLFMKTNQLKQRDFQVSNVKKSNKSVSENLERVLLSLNRISRRIYKLIGIRLAVTIWGFQLNPTIFTRGFLSKFIKSEKIKRDLSWIEELYRKDWQKARKLIHHMSKR